MIVNSDSVSLGFGRGGQCFEVAACWPRLTSNDKLPGDTGGERLSVSDRSVRRA